VENVPDADEAPETEETKRKRTTDEQAPKRTARKMRRVFQAHQTITEVFRTQCHEVAMSDRAFSE